MTVLEMHTEEDDTVLHIEKTGMLMLVVEIDVGGMTADVVDKLNCSSDDVEPRQVDLMSAHALTEFHWHDTHVDPDRHEVDQRAMKILGNSHGVILLSCIQTYQTHRTVCTPYLALSKTCLASALESFPITLYQLYLVYEMKSQWNHTTPEWSRFVTIVKQTQEMDTVSYHKLFEILKQYQKEVKEIRVEKIARNANPLALVAAAQQYLDTYYQAQKPQRSYAKFVMPLCYLAIRVHWCRPIRKEGCASWDLGKGTWGGRARVL
nr:hypothetical protein [Tanacetum cinerariifolium]